MTLTWLIAQKDLSIFIHCESFKSCPVRETVFTQIYTVLLQTGFGLVTGFTEHRSLTISHYSAIANSHIQQFTRACTKSSQSAVSPPVTV
jgi:hypothetical protein